MPPRWNIFERVAFRFGFAFAVLLVLPFPAGVLPKTDWLAEKYSELWSWLVHRAGDLVGIDIPPPQPTGSGDTTEAYVQMALAIVLAALAAAVWSALDRKRLAYPRLASATRVALRYWLACALLGYGIIKIWKTQFPDPEVLQLEERVGDMSPMGMLWTFMGSSTAYTVFAGIMETVAGLLLLWRRTTLIGALVASGVLLNVVMLNFCYDVPVKLYSSTLLGVAAVIAAPDARRVIACLLGHATPEAIPPSGRWPSLRLERARLVGKHLAIAWVLYQQVSGQIDTRREYIDVPKPALYGAYDVESFTGDGLPWQKLIVGTYVAQVVRSDGAGYMQLDASDGGQLTVSGQKGPEGTLAYTRTGDRLVLDGTWRDKKLHAVLHARGSDYLLVTRGFHWIQELPFNR